MTDREQLRALIKAAREFGDVDVMMNNAGLMRGGSILELDPEEFEQIHAVNAESVYFGTQVAANDMLDRDDPGVIVNTASISSNTAQFD